MQPEVQAHLRAKMPETPTPLLSSEPSRLPTHEQKQRRKRAGWPLAATGESSEGDVSGDDEASPPAQSKRRRRERTPRLRPRRSVRPRSRHRQLSGPETAVRLSLLTATA